MKAVVWLTITYQLLTIIRANSVTKEEKRSLKFIRVKSVPPLAKVLVGSSLLIFPPKRKEPTTANS